MKKALIWILFLSCFIVGCNDAELIYETLNCQCQKGYKCMNGSDLTNNKDICFKDNEKGIKKFFERLECNENVVIEDLSCKKMKLLIESGVIIYPVYTVKKVCNYQHFNHIWTNDINIRNRYLERCME